MNSLDHRMDESSLAMVAVESIAPVARTAGNKGAVPKAHSVKAQCVTHSSVAHDNWMGNKDTDVKAKAPPFHNSDNYKKDSHDKTHNHGHSYTSSYSYRYSYRYRDHHQNELQLVLPFSQLLVASSKVFLDLPYHKYVQPLLLHQHHKIVLTRKIIIDYKKQPIRPKKKKKKLLALSKVKESKLEKNL